MKSVVTRGIGDSSVEEAPRPSPASDEVLIKTNRVQLSVTECWTWQGELGMSKTMRRRIDEGDGRILGHEFCGEIVETGADVNRFDVGDRVYAPGKIPCYECAYCENDWEFLCENKGVIGHGENSGALAEYFVARMEPLRRLPDGVSDAEGAAMQPLAASVLVMHDTDVTTGDEVAVIGAGIMGAQCGQLALEMGADRVFAIDIDAEKLRVAEELGMIPIDVRDGDPVESIRTRTAAVGPDVVISAVGGDQTHATYGSDPRAQAFQMVRNGGTLVQVGIVTGELRVDPGALHDKAPTVVYPTMSKGVLTTGPNSDTGQLAPRLVADGRVEIEPYISHELRGLDSFEEAIEITTNKEEYSALGPAQMVITD